MCIFVLPHAILRLHLLAKASKHDQIRLLQQQHRSPSWHHSRFSPTDAHTTPPYRPKQGYQKGKLDVSEWWLEPPFLLRELRHVHVDGLVEPREDA